MRDGGKKNVLGVMVDSVDYDAAVQRIMEAAKERRSFAATALAVHGVMTGRDPHQRHRLNQLDLVTPDGQPVRWALNLLHRQGLSDRVYGPTLMLHLCEQAQRQGASIFLYGTTQNILTQLVARLHDRFPALKVAGTSPSLFRQTTVEEKTAIADKIRSSGADVAFIGLGCPRQEVFLYEYRHLIPIPLVAVGAAFEYHAGVKKEPPLFVQKVGLQWLHRLAQDPRRLWKRYLLLNSAYVGLLVLQGLRVWKPDGQTTTPPEKERLYG